MFLCTVGAVFVDLFVIGIIDASIPFGGPKILAFCFSIAAVIIGFGFAGGIASMHFVDNLIDD